MVNMKINTPATSDNKCTPINKSHLQH